MESGQVHAHLRHLARCRRWTAQFVSVDLPINSRGDVLFAEAVGDVETALLEATTTHDIMVIGEVNISLAARYIVGHMVGEKIVQQPARVPHHRDAGALDGEQHACGDDFRTRGRAAYENAQEATGAPRRLPRPGPLR